MPSKPIIIKKKRPSQWNKLTKIQVYHIKQDWISPLEHAGELRVISVIVEQKCVRLQALANYKNSWPCKLPHVPGILAFQPTHLPKQSLFCLVQNTQLLSVVFQHQYSSHT